MEKKKTKFDKLQLQSRNVSLYIALNKNKIGVIKCTMLAEYDF